MDPYAALAQMQRHHRNAHKAVAVALSSTSQHALATAQLFQRQIPASQLQSTVLALVKPALSGHHQPLSLAAYLALIFQSLKAYACQHNAPVIFGQHMEQPSSAQAAL